MSLADPAELFVHLKQIAVGLEVERLQGKWVVWLACALYVLLRRPRAVLAIGATWSAWMGWQVYAAGADAVDAMMQRGLVALEATDRFSEALVALAWAWGDFFLPLLSDVARVGVTVWDSTTPEQRCYFAAGLVAIAVTIKLCKVIYTFARVAKDRLVQAVTSLRQAVARKVASVKQGTSQGLSATGAGISRGTRFTGQLLHTIVAKVLFYGSFLVTGGLSWKAMEHVSDEWLLCGTGHLIATVPAFRSMLAMRSGGGPASAAGSSASSGALEDEQARRKTEQRRYWLCYWAFWPVLSLLHYGSQVLPGMVDIQPEYIVASRRSIVIFALWLQIWRGCTLLQSTLLRASSTSLPETIFSCFGAGGLRALGLLRQGASQVDSGTLWKNWRLIGWVMKNKYLIVAAALASVVVGAFFVWLFYRVVATASTCLTLAIWCFAAFDTASDLANDAVTSYQKKLAFWVLAMFWSLLTELPIVGGVLGIFTPFVFSLALFAGDLIVRRVVVPLLTSSKFLVRVAQWISSFVPWLASTVAWCSKPLVWMGWNFVRTRATSGFRSNPTPEVQDASVQRAAGSQDSAEPAAAPSRGESGASSDQSSPSASPSRRKAPEASGDMAEATGGSAGDDAEVSGCTGDTESDAAAAANVQEEPADAPASGSAEATERTEVADADADAESEAAAVSAAHDPDASPGADSEVKHDADADELDQEGARRRKKQETGKNKNKNGRR